MTIVADLSPDTAAEVARIIELRGCSFTDFAIEAIERAVAAESEFMAFIQEGIDDLEAGRVVDHATAMAELDQRIAKHEARCGR